MNNKEKRKILTNKLFRFAKKHHSNLFIRIKHSKIDGKLYLYATCRKCKQENRYRLGKEWL